MEETKVYNDWTVLIEGVGVIAPTLIWNDTRTPFIRSDRSEAEQGMSAAEISVTFNYNAESLVTAAYVYDADGGTAVASIENGNAINVVVPTSKDGTLNSSTTIKTVDGYVIAGREKTADGKWGSWEFQNAHLSQLRYDSETGAHYFYGVTGKKCWLCAYKAPYQDSYQIKNIGFFNANNELQIITNVENKSNYYELYNVYYARTDRLSGEVTLHRVQIHTNDVCAMLADDTVDDKINGFGLTAEGVYLIDRHTARGNFGYQRFFTTPAYSYMQKSTSAADALTTAKNDVYSTWKTPTEFYSESNTSDFPEGENGYTKAPSKVNKNQGTGGATGETDTKKAVPIWFWCNSLANWCTFMTTDEFTTDLYAWNGHNGWDNFKNICVDSDESDVIKSQYFYDINRFIKGPTFTATIDSTFALGEIKQIFNKAIIDNSLFVMKSISLAADTKFSQYDGETMQSVKPTKVYLGNSSESGRVPMFMGIPVIQRLPSGEISLVYNIRITGQVSSKPVILAEQIDYINTVCKAFFGDGSDKTIADDWKEFDKIKDVSEERATTVYTNTDSTLVNAAEINTTQVDGETLSMTLSIGRQYPETADVIDDAYVERWNK